MEPEQIYHLLEDLAEKIGISIEYHRLDYHDVPFRSGLCKIKGRYVYIMDSSKSIREKIELLASCISKMDLENYYVVPVVRDLIERYQE